MRLRVGAVRLARRRVSQHRLEVAERVERVARLLFGEGEVPQDARAPQHRVRLRERDACGVEVAAPRSLEALFEARLRVSLGTLVGRARRGREGRER
jgi:hypothetical protein